MLQAAPTLLVVAAVTGLLIWLLIYCLRVGAVGSYWAGDASREKQPVRFWFGIAALAFASAMGFCGLLYLVLSLF